MHVNFGPTVEAESFDIHAVSSTLSAPGKSGMIRALDQSLSRTLLGVILITELGVA
jgi:hypothetical protein